MIRGVVRITSRRLLAGALISLGVLTAAGALAPSYVRARNHRRNVAIACEWGQLAPLPVPAANVLTVGWPNLFACSIKLKFQADPRQIDRFIERSPGLAGVVPERFTPDHQYLPLEEVHGLYADFEIRHRYFHASEVPWFDRAIRERGRRYEIRAIEGCHGELVIDDARSVVYLKISYS